MAFGRTISFLKHTLISVNKFRDFYVLVCDKLNNAFKCPLRKIIEFIVSGSTGTYIERYLKLVDDVDVLESNNLTLKQEINSTNNSITTIEQTHHITKTNELFNDSDVTITTVANNLIVIDEYITALDVNCSKYTELAKRLNIIDLYKISEVSSQNINLSTEIQNISNNFNIEADNISSSISSVIDEIDEKYEELDAKNSELQIIKPHLSIEAFPTEISDLVITCCYEITLLTSYEESTLSSETIIQYNFNENNPNDSLNLTAQYDVMYLTTYSSDSTADIHISCDGNENEDTSFCAINSITFTNESDINIDSLSVFFLLRRRQFNILSS